LKKIFESANVKVYEDIYKPSRSYGYDSNDHNDNSNRGRQVQIQNQVQIILVDPINQEEERIKEFEIQENPKTPRNVILNHFEDKIKGDKKKGVQTRRRIAKEYFLISQIEPKNVNKAFEDEHWVKSMEEELK
jgi:hypothetical protein